MTQTEWKEIFGNNLVDILKDNDMSQARLARETGLSISRISDYINGNAAPSIFAIINMAYALDIDISEFVDFGETIE